MVENLVVVIDPIVPSVDDAHMLPFRFHRSSTYEHQCSDFPTYLWHCKSLKQFVFEVTKRDSIDINSSLPRSDHHTIHPSSVPNSTRTTNRKPPQPPHRQGPSKARCQVLGPHLRSSRSYAKYSPPPLLLSYRPCVSPHLSIRTQFPRPQIYESKPSPRIDPKNQSRHTPDHFVNHILLPSVCFSGVGC